MSIAKIFVKVFGEDIFEKPDNGKEQEDEPSCSKNPPPTTDERKDEEAGITQQIVVVKSWLQRKLDAVDSSAEEIVRHQRKLAENRLGPELTVFDIDFTSTVRVSSDRLSVRSQGSFNTIKANVCVIGGQWMYEVQLHSKGVMQIGWCSNSCSFNENSGVGDSKHSYGFDGSKQQIWHIATTKYGDKWQVGDIIGLCIDVDNEIIEFYRNGHSMGVAYNKLERGPGISFFPAVSLGYNQGLNANFGGTPFRYPVAGYEPLQAKPVIKMRKAAIILDYLVNIATILSRSNCKKDKKKKDSKRSTKRIVYIVFTTLLVEKLSKVIFDAYVLESNLMPLIKDLCSASDDKDASVSDVDSPLGTFLSLLWNYLEGEEIRFILKKVLNTLLLSYTCTHKGLDYEKQRETLFILNCICYHPTTRRFYLENKFFKKHCLALFMYPRAPEFNFMQELIPDRAAWTEGIGGPQSKYLSICDKITKSTGALYEQQRNLLMNLLTNSDGDAEKPSSRKMFILKLRRYAMDISLEQRPFHSLFFMQSSIHHPVEPKVALSFLCILVDVTKALFALELPGREVEIDPKCFFDNTFEYQHYDRLGGVLSHLRKVHRADVAQHLGNDRAQELLDDDRTVMRTGELETSLFVTPANINTPPITGRQQGTPLTHLFSARQNVLLDPTPGNSKTELSLYELLDICVLYYYCVGHKYIVKISSVREEIATLNEVLLETKYYREDVERKLQALEDHASVCMNENHVHIVSDLKVKFTQRENVFAKRSIQLARKQAWYRAVALGKHKRLILIWLLEKIFKTLNVASEKGPLFTFVPEIYINILPIILDTVMDFSFHDLLNQFDVEDSECVINIAAEFLGTHSADPRIILASCKDSLLQALGTLTCHKPGVKSLEQASKKSQYSLVKSLLRPYENRAWGQSNWLLLRFWLGEGFAYRQARQPSIWQGGNDTVPLGLCRYRSKNEMHTGLLHHIAPANPSKYFQKMIGTRLVEDEPFATTFLNSVLSQLNWAFSEFILLLQEIQNAAHRQENSVFEPKQLKICSMCFELTVSLMRCLEMIVTVAPAILQDSSRPNSDLILNRVCQLISQVLSRVTVPPGCFQFVVDMCYADLSSVSHFPIITAALGILLALFRSELDSEKNPAKVTRVSRALLTDPSFQFANLEFALGEIRTPILQQVDIPRGNFDPQTRAHIDPLTNDVRVPMPSTSNKRIRADPPIIKFSLNDYPTHVTSEEIDDVRRLIEMLRVKQSLLSEITLPSEDSLCPICCAKPIAVMFTPCKHQSCSNCILQHLMNSKVCFYCKTLIKTIEAADGTVIYQNNDYLQTPSLLQDI